MYKSFCLNSFQNSILKHLHYIWHRNKIPWFPCSYSEFFWWVVSHLSDWIRTRKMPNRETFHAVLVWKLYENAHFPQSFVRIVWNAAKTVTFQNIDQQIGWNFDILFYVADVVPCYWIIFYNTWNLRISVLIADSYNIYLSNFFLTIFPSATNRD